MFASSDTLRLEKKASDEVKAGRHLLCQKIKRPEMQAVSKLTGDLLESIMPKAPGNLVSTSNLEQTTSEIIREETLHTR